jgi:hypothetical protein
MISGALLVGGNDGVRQWGWDDIPIMKWKIPKSCLKPPDRYWEFSSW